MASTTLAVTVFGGLPPVPIDIFLYESNIKILQTQIHGSTPNFQIDNLVSTFVYKLFIGGENPLEPGSGTKCELNTDQISIHPPDDSPILKTGFKYLVEFRFTVK